MDGFRQLPEWNRAIGWAAVAVLLLAVVGVGSIVYLLIRLVVLLAFDC